MLILFGNLAMGALGGFAYLIFVTWLITPYPKNVHKNKIYLDILRAVFLGGLAAFIVYVSWGMDLTIIIRQLLLSLLAGFSFRTVWSQHYSRYQRSNVDKWADPLNEFK